MRSFVLLGAALMCVASVTLVSARSNGQLDTCDLSPYYTGTPNLVNYFWWQNGRYGGKNLTNGYGNSGIMAWAVAPAPASFYTLRTGDDSTPNDDVNTYTPGQLTEIHLRSSDVLRKWIGLVLYATNGSIGVGNAARDRNVGSWSYPIGSRFQVISCTANPGQVVTHVDADLKPLHTRFFFTAPPGTGDVTLRILIKQGEQNKGSFFYVQKSLVLKEVAASVPALPSGGGTTSTGEPVLSTTLVSQNVLGGAGKTCADTCLQQSPATPYCAAVKTASINTGAALNTAIASLQACRAPLLQGCPYTPTSYYDTTTGYCTFRSESSTACPKSLITEAAPSTCFTATAVQNRPLCVCTNDRSLQPANPFQTSPRRRLLSYPTSTESDRYQPTSSASSSKVSMIAFAFTAILSSMFSIKSRSSLLVIASLMLVSLASPASAHNYIKSQHRAREAAVSIPCQQRIGNQPHVQVVRGQEFEVEWSLGHGDQPVTASVNNFRFWFAIIHEDDYAELAAQNITSILDEYLTQSPTNASIKPDGWNKVHLHNKAEDAGSIFTSVNTNGVIANYSITKYFDVWDLPKTDINWMDREYAYRKLAHPTQYADNTTTILSKFKPQYLEKDRRASYESVKYPWLLHASMFYNHIYDHVIVVNQADIARFKVPEFAKKDGDYILYFNWQGYKDCVDINLVKGTTKVAARYGIAPNATDPKTVTNAVKLDHAEIFNIGFFHSSPRKVNRTTMDATPCIQDCRDRQIYGCSHVQVVRYTNPTGTLPMTVNIPWYSQYYNNASIPAGVPQPCAFYTVHERTIAGCVMRSPYTVGFSLPATLGLANDDYVCFGVQPMRNQDLQVAEDFQIVTDKSEPAYYSTVYILDPNKSFLNIPVTPVVPPAWETDVDTCLTCDSYAKYQTLATTTAPRWTDSVSNVCMNCDEVNSKASVSILKSRYQSGDSSAAGRRDAIQMVEQIENEFDAYDTLLATSSQTLDPSSVGKLVTVQTTSNRFLGLQRFASGSPVTGWLPIPSGASSAIKFNIESVKQLSAENDAHFIVANPNPFTFASTGSPDSTVIPGTSTVSIDITDVTGKSMSISRLAAPIADFSYSFTQSYDWDECPSDSCEPVCKFYDEPTDSWVFGDLVTSVNTTGTTVTCTTSTPGSVGILTSKVVTNTDGGEGDSSSSSSSLSAFAIGLIIAGGVLAIILLGVIIFFAVRSSSSSASHTNMKRMAAETHQSNVAMA